jgi:hypothetical protein
MHTANENPVPSASVSFPLIYRSFARTLLISPNRRHPLVTPDQLRGLKPLGQGGALFVSIFWWEWHGATRISLLGNIRLLLNYTGLFWEKTYTPDCMVSQDRRHLFVTLDSSRTMVIAAYPMAMAVYYDLSASLWRKAFAKLHATAPRRQSALYCTCTDKKAFSMQQWIRSTFFTRAKQGCQLM